MKIIITLMCALSMLLGAPGAAQATVVYVRSDVAASGAGTTWSTAYKTLQEALAAASSNSAITQVWVKAGTYYPTAYPTGLTGGSTVRDYAFGLKSGLAIYGGFAGTETATTQRVAGNTTTLSGDIGTVGNNTDNCYHVLVTSGVDNTALLDGVTVTLGNANATTTGVNSFSRGSGGGLFNSSSSPALTNCVFSANAASVNGGGVYATASSPTLTGCTFQGNSVASATANTFGGGLYASGSGTTTLTGCTFTSNSATTSATTTYGGEGGGVYSSSTVTMTSCLFSGNSVTGHYGGGGISNSGGTLSARNCALVNNTSGSTGDAYGSGGGCQNEVSGTATFTSCVLVGNKANGASDDGGGALANYGTTITLSSCTLLDNTTASTANPGANGVFITSGATCTAVNTILWGAAAQVYNGGTTTITYSDVKGGYAGTGNLNAPPSFNNSTVPAGADGRWGTADDGLTVKSCAPTLNAGTTPSPAVPTDYVGNARVGAYDQGAYEYQGTSTPSTLAPATTTVTTTQAAATTTTYGDCDNLIAMVASTGASPVNGSVMATVYVQGSTQSAGGVPYLSRTYDIRPATSPDAATATITLYYLQADFTDYNANRGSRPPLPVDGTDAAGYKANLRVNQQHGTSPTGKPGTYTGYAGTGAASVVLTPTSVTYNAPLARWEVTFPITGFSGFFATTSTAVVPLPVQLVAFTAQVAGPAAVRLAWTTASELHSARFEVERSLDGQAFIPVGTVAAAGSSATTRPYDYLDAAAPAGPLYYRLRQVDLDGTASYSPVRVVVLSRAGRLVLYPNPAPGGAATLTGAASGMAVRVLDALGRVVGTATTDATGTVALGGLAPGLYVVRVGSSSVRLAVE